MTYRSSNFRTTGWKFIIGSSRDEATYYAPGWRLFQFGIFYLHTIPHDGAYATRQDYKGFWLKVRYWLPFEIERNR